jgi:hypothetical protein
MAIMLVRSDELCGTVAHTCENVFTAEIAKIKADIEVLERFRDKSADGSNRKLIQEGIWRTIGPNLTSTRGASQ